MGCSSRGLSTRSRRRRRPGHCIGGLIRSLPDSLPRVVARYRPASKCFLPGRRRYDVAYREELSRNVHRRRGVHVCHRGRYPPRDPLVALISATTGAVVDQSVFPTTPSGLDRALTWITRMVGNDSVLVVIEGIGSYGAGLAERIGDAGLLVAEPAAMPAGQRRGVGKTDALDAVRIARSVLGVDSSRLRWPRATGPRVVLRVLVVAREQMVAEHTRAINALTALLRTIDLGIDTRKPLSRSQIKVIARWRPRVEESVSRAFSTSDPVGQAHRRPQWRAGRQPQGTRCRRRRNRSGTVRAARRRLGGRRIRLDCMVAPRPGAIRSGIRRTSRNLPNTRRPQETPCGTDSIAAGTGDSTVH